MADKAAVFSRSGSILVEGSSGATVQYNPALDGLRAIAVLMVLAYHAKVPGFNGMFVGVDVFFVLSGFLISSILLRRTDQLGIPKFREFYIRRFFRLAPALLAMLAVYVLFAPLAWPEYNHARDATAAALYFSNYTKAFLGFPDYISHTWSLSVEEQFYLVWPPILYLLHKRYAGNRLPLVLAVLFLVATAWRWAWLSHGHSWDQAYYRADTRMSGLILGSALAAALSVPHTKALLQRASPYLYILPIIAVAVLHHGWKDHWVLWYGIPLTELGTAAVVMALAFRERWLTEILSNRLLVLLGTLSYGIYLWHYPLMRFLRQYGWETNFIVGTVASITLAWISSKTVEEWGRIARDNILRKHPGPVES